MSLNMLEDVTFEKLTPPSYHSITAPSVTLADPLSDHITLSCELVSVH